MNLAIGDDSLAGLNCQRIIPASTVEDFDARNCDRPRDRRCAVSFTCQPVPFQNAPSRKLGPQALLNPGNFNATLRRYLPEPQVRSEVDRIGLMLKPDIWSLTGVLALTMAGFGAKADTIETAKGAVVITPIQHATFTLEAGGKRIYVDPAPADLFGGKPKADLILITDIHGDHMDPGAVQELSTNGTVVIAPAAVAKSITAAKVLNNGQETSWEGWTIRALPMYNLKRGPAPGKLFHTKGRGNGYVLEYGGKRFYISGDTENIPEMQALKDIDVAFVCMNLPYTMTAEEAADAVKSFHPKIAYPYHYRGQPSQDPHKFAELLKGSGVDVRVRDWYSK